MSKRVPVYLSEQELDLIRVGLENLEFKSLNGVHREKLMERVNEQLQTFDDVLDTFEPEENNETCND